MPTDNSTTKPNIDQLARYDVAAPAVVIECLQVTDPEVVSESRRWSTGRRGPAVAPNEMTSADLTPFITQALTIGVRAIVGAGGAVTTFELESLVADIGERTTESTTKAAASTIKATEAASTAMKDMAESARKAILETQDANRKRLEESMTETSKQLREELARLLGGDQPELLERLAPVLDKAGRTITEQAQVQTTNLLDRVTKQFDPADPTSPFAKQAKSLQEQQLVLAESMEKHHRNVTDKVDSLLKAVEVRKEADRIASVTPLKGATYEDRVHGSMRAIAAGLGAEYEETGTTTGALPRCKKGDGLLHLDGDAKVVLEMHHGDGRPWSKYLDTAERNRQAQASIGLVPSVDRNAGQTIRVIAPHRVVLAFDPEDGDDQLLRTVVQLMRARAQATVARVGIAELATAEEEIAQAIGLLDEINKVLTATRAISKQTTLVDKHCGNVQAGVARHLNAALTAINGAARDVIETEGDVVATTDDATNVA